jgi:hypothetical protein
MRATAATIDIAVGFNFTMMSVDETVGDALDLDGFGVSADFPNHRLKSHFLGGFDGDDILANGRSGQF